MSAKKNVLLFHTLNACNDMIYLTPIGLPPVGSSTVHIYTQTIHRTTQSTQTIHRTTQFTNKKECGPCPSFAGICLTTEEKSTEKPQSW